MARRPLSLVSRAINLSLKTFGKLIEDNDLIANFLIRFTHTVMSEQCRGSDVLLC